VLRGERVLLRALERAEVEETAAWELDPATWQLVDDEPYVPKTTADVVKAYDEGRHYRADAKRVPFAVDVDGAVVGGIALWGVDLHSRRAHLGISLAPHARGRGLGTDAVRVLLRYAFSVRGLHRVQLEALADNANALACYRRAGFVEEGRMREDAWLNGRWVDNVVMGVLAQDWAASQAAARS